MSHVVLPKTLGNVAVVPDLNIRPAAHSNHPESEWRKAYQDSESVSFSVLELTLVGPIDILKRTLNRKSAVRSCNWAWRDIFSKPVEHTLDFFRRLFHFDDLLGIGFRLLQNIAKARMFDELWCCDPLCRVLLHAFIKHILVVRADGRRVRNFIGILLHTNYDVPELRSPAHKCVLSEDQLMHYQPKGPYIYNQSPLFVFDSKFWS